MIIKAGYYNWNEFGLSDSFYPEDMPEEWRLAFYANDIECTQISLNGLDNHSLDDIEELFEDLSPQFSLMVRCDDVDQWGLLKTLLDAEIKIAALIISESFQEKWSKSLVEYSVPYIIEGELSPISFAKHVDAKQLLKNNLNIIYLDELLGLKSIRLLIEQWIEQGLGEEYYLLLNPSVYQSSMAGDIRVMIEMMGY